MTTDQVEIFFAGIKGCIDASCINTSNNTLIKFKKDVKYRCSHYIPIASKKLMNSILEYAVSQYRAEKTLKALYGELYKHNDAFGDVLVCIQRIAKN